MLNIANANQPPSRERVVQLLWERFIFIKSVNADLRKVLVFHEGLMNAQIISDLVELGLVYDQAVLFLEKLETLSMAIESKQILQGIVENVISASHN
jgi:hypothetical protein